MENNRDLSPISPTHELTKSQLSMWTGQLMSPQSPMYNMALVFYWSSPIDLSRFRSAFQALLQNCEVMRSIFMEEEGRPRQKVLNDFSYKMELLDFSELPDKEAKLREWLNRRSAQIFDISQCLFDAVLIKMGEEKYVWFFNQHHLITDAWSVTVQYQALMAYYHQQDFELPPFSRYVRYEAEQGRKAREGKAGAYWQEKAERLPDPPAFYGRFNREMESASVRVGLRLSKETSDTLRALTQETDLRAWTQHLSLFNIFSTLVFSYIYRVTGQQKLAIGTPAHNRTTNAFKKTPGLFIELFPLMTEVEEADTFSTLLEKVRNDSHDFLRYAQTGASNSTLSRSFNVVLNYINAAFTEVEDLSLQSEWVHSGHADPGHHIRVQVYDFDATGCIELGFDLNEAVFDEAQRKAMPKHFMALLESFIADRFQPIAKVPLAESQITLSNLDSDFQMEEQATVLDLFEKQASAAAGELPALRFGTQQLTYAELDAHANRLANYLLANGLQRQDRVAILLRRSPELIISILAVLKAGAAFIPIPTNYPSGRILGILEDAQARLILSNSVLSAALPQTFDHLINLDKESTFIQQQASTSSADKPNIDDLAYIMYTSGSTGLPKGVMIGHRSLSHYIQWAQWHYTRGFRPVVPLFTAIGFDLTITSMFLPLVAGGSLLPYEEAEQGPDLALLEVLENPEINFIKLTPSHLAMLQGKAYPESGIKSMIVGGENFKTDLAEYVQTHFNPDIRIFNEYGPTEATVGCVVHQYQDADRKEVSVPIGQPIPNTSVYVLDDHLHPVPVGVTGELYLGGIGLAKAYWQQEELTADRFVANPFQSDTRLYRTGDLVRQHPKGYLEYLGRKDQQVKIRGRRVELAEIEAVLNQHPGVDQGVVDLRQRQKQINPDEVFNCVECGLPSNYPTASFDEAGRCHLCQSFDSYQEKVSKYFKTKADLQAIFDNLPASEREYDCLMLLSGGKDSTYALGQLKEMGLNVLSFTLDNGYISEEAKANIRRVTGELGVDHVFGETEAMNAIFVDSLQRHCDVCDGCFKTIYTLSIQLALEKKIPFIITGLSRGQFFETRLTEELFRQEEVDVDKIDEIILTARKAYHQVDDAVKRLMDVSMFEDEQVFEKVRFLDFYRYTDVSLAEMLEYLDKRLPWVRPSDTGRSTNCLINQAGIYVHKKKLGYSNYAFPYSWDVRIGHKTRDASLEEINEEIDEKEVNRILDEIGYTQAEQADRKNEQLVAYYVGAESTTEAELRNYLLGSFPDYMVPVQFIRLDHLPLTVNGKIDRDALPEPDAVRPVLQMEYVAPRTEFEEIIQELWSDVMQIDQVGIYDNFIDIGGDSLSGIRLMARLNEAFELDLAVNLIFQQPTIAQLSNYVEETIKTLLLEMDGSESE